MHKKSGPFLICTSCLSSFYFHLPHNSTFPSAFLFCLHTILFSSTLTHTLFITPSCSLDGSESPGTQCTESQVVLDIVTYIYLHRNRKYKEKRYWNKCLFERAPKLTGWVTRALIREGANDNSKGAAQIQSSGVGIC